MAGLLGEWHWLLAFVPYAQPGDAQPGHADMEAAGAIQGPGMCTLHIN